MANEVGGDDLLLSVLENSLEGTLSSSLDGGLDLIVRGGLVEAGDEVNNGDIKGGDTEGETAVMEIRGKSASSRRRGRT